MAMMTTGRRSTILSYSLAALSLLPLALLSPGCGGNGGGDGPPGTTPGAVSGRLIVPPGNIPETEPNDTVARAQPLLAAQRVSGYASLADPGFPLPGSPGIEAEDLYALGTGGPVRLTLTIAANNPSLDDLDLVLMDGSGTTVLDVSEGTFSTELIEIPAAGNFLIGIRAYQGASAYVLSVDSLSGLTGASGDVIPAEAEFVPGEALVKVRADRERHGAGALRVAGRHGLSATPILPQGVSVMRAPATPPSPGSGKMGGRLAARGRRNALRAFTLDMIGRLRAEPDVEYAEPNFIRRALLVPNDNLFALQWHYGLIGLPQAWDDTTGSDDVVVAVLDTGVLSGHPDLEGRLIPGYDFVSDAANGDGDGRDANPEDAAARYEGFSHGTHVSGTIGASTNNAMGVAGATWQTRIMPVRVLGRNGGTDADIAQAIRYAAGLPNASGRLSPRPAKVVNMSLGGTGFGRTVQDAVNAARAQGLIVVAAAGNENSGTPFYPASYDGVVSVSAVDPGARKAPYSNFGPRIDAAAPGGDMSVDGDGDGYSDGVLSTDGDGLGAFFSRFLQGTSMASPHVAGVVALMLSANPDLVPLDIDQLLAGTHPDTPARITRDLGSPGRDDFSGHGLIDAAQAVGAARAIPGGAGTPGDAVLAVSSDSLEFGEFLSSLPVDVTNAGRGELAVTGATDDAPWLTVSPSSGATPLLLTAVVDRAGLAPGPHDATVTIGTDAGQGSPTATVTVRMTVGGRMLGNVGTVYVLLLDADTLAAVGQAAAGPAGAYAFTVTGVPPGAYFVLAGTDRDDDGFICDIEDACGASPDPVTVAPGQVVGGIRFVVGDGTGSRAAGQGPTGIRGRTHRRLH